MSDTVFITGGSRGIGRACVESFYAAGFKVAFCYNQNDEAAKSLLELCPEAISIKADIAEPENAEKAAFAALCALGHIDALVLNAGVSLQKLITDTSLDEWDRLFNINLRSMFVTAKAVLPDMLHRKSGNIVTVSSMWGQSGASCEVAYSAAKAGVIGFSKALAKETGPSGIRVNCVCPGVINTDMNACHSEETLRELADETPLCRLGETDEVASVILSLCSPAHSFVTGQVLGVNGGMII